jgi:hypothetical protein
MMNGRWVIWAVLSGLVLTTAGYADMVAAPELGVTREPPVAVSGMWDGPYASSLSPLQVPGDADLGILPVPFLPQNNSDPEQAGQSQHPQALTDGVSSLSLCLSALMGLGLCGSLHWFKRLHVGFIPDWYHDGGPFQVGHSHAVTPNALCTVPAYCFIQPDFKASDTIPHYRLGTIMSLWRMSQFTPNILASRGPPITS